MDAVTFALWTNQINKNQILNFQSAIIILNIIEVLKLVWHLVEVPEENF